MNTTRLIPWLRLLRLSAPRMDEHTSAASTSYKMATALLHMSLGLTSNPFKLDRNVPIGIQFMAYRRACALRRTLARRDSAPGYQHNLVRPALR